MTDNAETAVQAIARRGMENAPDWAQNLFDLIVAVDADWNKAHQQSVEAVRAMSGRVGKLEDGRARCAERVRQLIEEEHEERHEAHMAAFHAPRRASDPPQADFSEDRRATPVVQDGDRRVWVMWGIGQKLLVVITATVSATASALLTHWLMQ